MPLIIITGHPCSGKTYRARQIAEAFTVRIKSENSPSTKTVQIVDSRHSLGDISPEDDRRELQTASLRDQIYNSVADEKRTRGEEFSAVKRAISKDNIVIADGLNYIKGYRYQLYCEAKAAGTRCCVVHVAAQEDECIRWNRERLRVWGRGDEDEDEDLEVLKDDLKINKEDDDLPESHTALYGDRLAYAGNVSRSSSTDGRSDGEIEVGNGGQDIDNMTLKSLYIHDESSFDTKKSNIDTPLPQSNSKSNDDDDDDSNEKMTSTSPTSISIPTPKSSKPYSPATLNSLQMRYEPPSPFSRWDTPLFTIPTSDENPPYTLIWSAIFPETTKKIKKGIAPLTSKFDNLIDQGLVQSTTTNEVKRNTATILPSATASNALQNLESTTQDIVKSLLVKARKMGIADGEGGDVVFHIPSSDEEISIFIPPGIILNQPLLQRLRRKYTQIQRGSIAHGKGYVGKNKMEIINAFVRFLEAEFNG